VSRNTLIIVGVSAVLIALIIWKHKVSSAQLIYFCVLIPSIILHEISHGAVALVFGDTTAKRAGRLSLNPIKHVDPVGTLLVPAVLTLSGVGAYGWAKPVPVMTGNLRSPRNHTVLVSLVGPLTNFVLAALMGVCFVAVGGRANIEAQIGYLSQVLAGQSGNLYPYVNPAAFGLVQQIFFYAGFANIVLGVFNLIPCPPLDGAAVLERFIPERYLAGYYNLQPFLMFLPFLLILVFHNAWTSLINDLITGFLRVLG
jgi:Zn-dependent protease